MADPTTRATFIEKCKRHLGHPVAKINVTEEQLDDRVDEALRYYWDYHFDGSEKTYFKHIVTANNHSEKVYNCNVVSAGTGYANSDTVVFTKVGGSGGSNAAATILTDANGAIQSCTLTNNGEGYAIAPTVSVTSGGGSGAEITCQLGGWLPVPENINGALRIFPIGFSQSSTQSIFNIRYQMALNDLYNFTFTSVVPFFSAFQHIEFLQDILVGEIPVRYNRHKDRVWIDMDWNRTNVGDVLIIEAYEVVDPDVWTDAWSDRWLIEYTSALIQLQWGANMKKFQGTMLPGGVQIDAVEIYNDAKNEIDKLRAEMISTYSLPPAMLIG